MSAQIFSVIFWCPYAIKASASEAQWQFSRSPSTHAQLYRPTIQAVMRLSILRKTSPIGTASALSADQDSLVQSRPIPSPGRAEGVQDRR